MGGEPGERYGGLSRIREEPWLLRDEASLQRLWFEEVYRNPLTTTTGEPIQIKHPGFWNRGAGPDFLHASLVNGAGAVETGHVEVHFKPPEWHSHRHDEDAAYEGVILHLVWSAGPRDFFPATRNRRVIRQVELSTQLKAPLAELEPLFGATEQERQAGARFGACRRELERMSAEARRALLEEAGWFRFHRKRRLWEARARLHGLNRALWLGLCEGMGFSENKRPFWSLGQRVGIELLLARKEKVERAALLFGVAGFLPTRQLAAGSSEMKGWLKSVWDRWWEERAEWEEHLLPRPAWALRGLRPLNRPERRLAALAVLSGPGMWKRIVAGLKKGDPMGTAEMLEELSDPVWDRHCTIAAKALARPQRLVGDHRGQALFFNILAPLAWSSAPDRVGRQLAEAVSDLPNKATRIGAVRLLGGLPRAPWMRRQLVQEGLIQIYQDFCLEQGGDCGTCTFPDLVRKFPERP